MVLRGILNGVSNTIDQYVISYTGNTHQSFQGLMEPFLEDLRANRESKRETSPPVPPEWGRESGKQTGLFFQGTVPITMTQINFAKNFRLCKVREDVVQDRKLVVFPLLR